MITEPAPDFVGRAIFCDDIRFEIDQKITYVGVYSGGMTIRSDFPATIPKFGISITFAQKKELFIPSIGIKVFMPGDPDDKPSIEAEAALPQELQSKVSSSQGPMILLGTNIILSPFTIQSPGVIRVRALREGVLHRLGALQVSRFGEAELSIDLPT